MYKIVKTPNEHARWAAKITVEIGLNYFFFFPASLLIFQWLYDETQLALDGSGQPSSLSKITQKQVQFIFKLAVYLRDSFKQAKVQ